MNAREQRGLAIAAKCKIEKHKGAWLVPSQSGVGKSYRVNPALGMCSCPDHIETGEKCKHQYAVEFTMSREFHADGTVTDTQEIKLTKKTTYKQDWPAYNAAQSCEKDRFQELLFDLCRNIAEPERKGVGRKPHTVKDSIFTMVFKVYGTVSSRRFSCDLKEAHERGYLSKPIPGLKTIQFFENPDFTPILKKLIHLSSLPLRAVESEFAIDSTGFGSNKFERWFDEKYGAPRKKAVWIKAHICCGVKTNVVTAVRISEQLSGDSPQFAPLVKETSAGFDIAEVSGDKAYASVENFEAVNGCGGTFFPAFKSNTTGAVGGHFEKAFHYFSFKKDEYLVHYHKRSNVESTFSMVKRKFGDSVRNKTDVAMVNEVLCKLLAHNLCVLNQEEHELGIESAFGTSAGKVLAA